MQGTTNLQASRSELRIHLVLLPMYFIKHILVTRLQAVHR
jgi:hypothetical protein